MDDRGGSGRGGAGQGAPPTPDVSALRERASFELLDAVDAPRGPLVRAPPGPADLEVEKGLMAANLRRVLASQAMTDKLGGQPLTAQELSVIWRVASHLWPFMRAGRSREAQVHDLLRELAEGDEPLLVGVGTVYGVSEMRYVRDYAKRRLARDFRQRASQIDPKTVNDRYLAPLTFLGCVLVQAREDMGF